jgi:serine protease Do
MDFSSTVRGGSVALASIALVALGVCTQLKAATLDEAVEQRVRAATLEVVQLKPAEGAVQYERALPTELIPYQERTDKYRSIGTAFAIGRNRYVTASHVLMVGLGSQFGPPALRDAAGNVYAIDQVLKYSDREDYALFSLQSEPQGVQPLQVGTHPSPNDTVFAVGNALGEGIVIRDGLFTSDTPEEMNGDWKWLRFSAAASPGNSGGPLVDQHGAVIGVVLRKTEAENLNYALPINLVVSDPEGVGRIEDRTPIRLPVMPDAQEINDVHLQFKLPLKLADFYQTVLKLSDGALQQAQARLNAENSARLFPHGDGADELLHQVDSSPFPRFVSMRQDGIWQINGINPPVRQLDDNGFMRISGGMIRLRAPDDVPLAQLYGDSKLLMDMILKGYPIQRNVGGEQVRVTSLGKAQELGRYTDSWGRTWEVRSWPIPFADIDLSALCLPTPEGYDVLLVRAQSGLRDPALRAAETLTSYLYLSLQGSLARWQEYLAIHDIQPHVFGTFQLSIDPDKYVRYQSKRFQMQLTPKLLPFNKDSELLLQTGFYRDGDAVVWDVAGLVVQQDQQRKDLVAVARVSRPEPALPQGLQLRWSKAELQQFPFNSTVFTNNGASTIRAVAKGTPADANVRYLLTVVGEGNQAQRAMSGQLAKLQKAFRPLEH